MLAIPAQLPGPMADEPDLGDLPLGHRAHTVAAIAAPAVVIEVVLEGPEAGQVRLVEAGAETIVGEQEEGARPVLVGAQLGPGHREVPWPGTQELELAVLWRPLPPGGFEARTKRYPG